LTSFPDYFSGAIVLGEFGLEFGHASPDAKVDFLGCNEGITA
jgi:hypothetical protein